MARGELGYAKVWLTSLENDTNCLKLDKRRRKFITYFIKLRLIDSTVTATDSEPQQRDSSGNGVTDFELGGSAQHIFPEILIAG